MERDEPIEKVMKQGNGEGAGDEKGIRRGGGNGMGQQRK